MVVHAVGVGDVDVEGVVIVSATEGEEEDVESAVGVVPVHGAVSYDEVGVDIMRKCGNEGGELSLLGVLGRGVWIILMI